MGKKIACVCTLAFAAAVLMFKESSAQVTVKIPPGGCPSWPSQPVTGTGIIADFHALASEQRLMAVLENIAQTVIPGCVGHSQMSNSSTVMVTIFAENFYGGRAGLVGAQRMVGGGAWSFNANHVGDALKAEQQAEEQKREEAEAAQKKAQELADARTLSQKLQTDFKAQTALEAWVNPLILKTNPFPYQGKVVGFMTTFQQMVGSGVAVFGGNFDVVANGVPNSEFTQPGAATILAVQVNGIKQIKVLGTDMPAVDGTYKGAYICKTQGCLEFIGPH